MTETAVLLADSGLDGGATAPLPPADRASWTENNAQTDEKIDRVQLLELSSDLIRSLHRRISGHRFRANKHDGTRLAVARALVQAITAHNQVLRDMEQEEIKDRLSRIEAALETREQERKYLEQIEREQAKRSRL